jgi:peptide/nickel transport system substrate-binding protein
MMTKRHSLAAILTIVPVLLSGCSKPRSDGPIAASVIGAAPEIRDPDRQPLATADAALIGATAQGLVRFDAAGQIEPGVALRWAVSDDGLYYTFRIEPGGPIDAEAAARRLRRAVSSASRNPLKPVLGAIDEIVAVTPEVIEIRLHAPRPNLLQLLAQPELALITARGSTGPMRIAERKAGLMLLTPIDADAPPGETPRGQVQLRSERAALAVARFASGQAAVVLGGTFVDLPILRAAKLADRVIRFDPVLGLFGLAFTDTSGFAGSVEYRRALAMAIDREALTARFDVQGWRGTTTLLPDGVADLPTPARPDWIDTPLDQRRAIAAEAIARWTEAEGAPPVIRVALPEGPGSSLLLAALRRDWRAIGVMTERVAADAPADLRLIDAVAPADIGSWYLRRFTCAFSRVCSEQADTALIAARDATTLAERARYLSEADARLTEITAYIPLASPLRWSLADPRGGLQPNARGVHPLNHLRRE